MVVENEITDFWAWLLPSTTDAGLQLGGLLLFVVIGAILAAVSLVVGYLTSLVRHGPLKAGDLTYRTLVDGVNEVLHLSPRRIFALAGLAFKEALRRRVLIALAVFAVVLVFAAWFLKNDYKDPQKLYLTVVFYASTFLTLVVALVLSTFSLPGDFQSKTIYTIVTKPVRASEIVLGRIVGFSAIGTVLLAVMGSVGYVFVVRSLDHTHRIDLASLKNLEDAEGKVVGQEGETTSAMFHRHKVRIDADGAGIADPAYGHEHQVTREGDDYVVSGPRGLMRARVPKRGTIYFLDRQGTRVASGISVGKEWTYRSYVDGGTPSAAVWTFDGIEESLLLNDPDDGQFLPVELAVRVFRSFKGDLERDIQGSIRIVNPETKLKSEEIYFGAKDYAIVPHDIPRAQFAQVDGERKPVDLLDDLVSKDGTVEVQVQCLEAGHYFGFARGDCFIRLPDGDPLWNYAKSLISTWVQMVLLVSIGVMASTFLSGPIALLFTVAFLILGFWRSFLVDIATEKVFGGGPIESLVRMVTQMNVMSPMEPSLPVATMQKIDDGLEAVLWAAAQMIPDIPALSTTTYVSEGFDIPSAMVWQSLAVMLAYVVGLAVAGYFFFRTREVAR